MINSIEKQIKDIFINSDRLHWESVTFGDIAKEVKQSVRSSTQEDLKVVGLEHINPLDLHIRRWDTLEKGTTFTKFFEKGQVLFGRRRAYQRKVAVAEFDGICSGDIIVMQALEDKLEPSLLPFIVRSTGFSNWAISTSAGSLSPRTKFKHLADFKLSIPPKEIQKEISNLLWKLDELREKYLILLGTQQDLFDSWFSNKLNQVSGKNKQKLGTFLLESPKYGANLSAVPFIEDKPRYIRITDIDTTGKLKEDEIVTIDSTDYKKYLLEDEDILIARTADPGKCFLYTKNYGPCVYAGYLIKFKFDKKKLLPKFFYLYSKSTEYKKFITSTKRTGTLSNINGKEFQSMMIPVIDIPKQKSLIEESVVFEESLNNQEKVLTSLDTLIEGVLSNLWP